MLRNQNGFSLIELIVVIVILGVLAGVLIPNVSKFSQQARVTADIATAANIAKAINIALVDESMTITTNPDIENLRTIMNGGKVAGKEWYEADLGKLEPLIPASLANQQPQSKKGLPWMVRIYTPNYVKNNSSVPAQICVLTFDGDSERTYFYPNLLPTPTP